MLNHPIKVICFWIALLIPDAVLGQESVTQTLAAECTTKGTDNQGRGQTCRSDRQEFHAPDNHVFAQNSLEKTRDDRNGRGPHCDETIHWDNFVEVIPGVTQPTTFIMSVSARSDGGIPNIGVRGWLKCTYRVDVVRYR